MTERDDGAPPRREVAPAVLAARAARQFVKPVQDKIGAWQAECVKLEVQTARVIPGRRRDIAVTDAVRALRDQIRGEAKSFEKLVSEAPASIQAQSRVTDTRMVLRMLDERLAQLMAEDGESPKKGR